MDYTTTDFTTRRVHNSERVVAVGYLRRAGLRAAIAELIVGGTVSPDVGKALLELVNGQELQTVRQIVEGLGGSVWNSHGEWAS